MKDKLRGILELMEYKSCSWEQVVDQAHKDILALLPSKDKLFDFLIQMPLSFTEEPVDYGEIAKAIHDLMVKSVKGEGK